MAFKRGQQQRVVVGMYDSTDTRVLKSGLTVSAQVSKDGGTPAASTNAVAEIGTTGVYTLLLTATEMDADVVAVKFTASGASDAVVAIYTTLISVEADGMVHADLKEWLGVAPLALASQLVQAQANQLGTQAKADVNAEVVDVLKTDTVSEPAQAAPSDTPTLEAMVNYLYRALINKVDVTGSVKRFHNAAGTVIWKKALSDDGTTYSEAKGAAGP